MIAVSAIIPAAIAERIATALGEEMGDVTAASVEAPGSVPS